MRSFCESVAHDGDFAEGVPGAVSWLGFPTRLNPLFLRPRGNSGTNPSNENSIGLEGVDTARLWDAQDFVLLKDGDGNTRANSLGGGEAKEGVRKDSSNNTPARKGVRGQGSTATIGKSGLPGKRRPRATTRDKVSAMNGQLAAAQASIRDLEESLRGLEAEREKNRARATRAGAAAAEAERQKQTQRMYRLRGAAAFLQEEMEEVSAEITMTRGRLFAEQQVRVVPTRTGYCLPI